MLIKNLNKKYSTHFALHIPELEFRDEGVSALVGPSGAGKTSILRVLSGLDSCPHLEWIFKGQDLAQWPISKRKIGFVFQSLELFPNMSAYENIRFAGKYSGSSVWKKDLDFLIESLNLSHCKNCIPDQLSGGEAQRTALARTLVIRPRILFLDEPFSSLDEENKQKARHLVSEMIQHYKIPALLVSHDRQDIQSLAHTVITVQNGCVKKSL